MTATDDIDEVLPRLVPSAVEGDGRALQRIIDLIHPPVVRYCRARVPSTKYPTPEDLAQEICLAVARAIPGYEDQGKPFMAFVYRIAANKIVDARRSQSRDLSVPTDEVPDQEVVTSTPETVAMDVSSCNEVVQLLDTLSDKARQIVTLRVFGGYSAEETAEIVGSTAGAVRVAQFRALAKMRETLETRETSRTE
ncbi:sigma-70 family RNA polymerase sigma factor [Corynebacterium kalidii]|jgi:RNA polymerase sigma-70 factor (ECF subfamily)|uniref:Sigma-70 family RNA polymerase sigma factor n=1 Tax=Corynebacterium kalidii TaxID=2931982 RepID=A0A9X1WF85_9CORY|nr:sigma-70 family RNA polymerase sigma factor [Corynebacterium kalidii]MCJ7857919.1 sigma-70 family RNA polymerase sigma factor [Corynebacterium kalidii]